jgi:uncharacterized protein
MAIVSDDSMLERMIARLVAALGPERIYLFGSRARGDQTAGSDWDLLVVVSSSSLPRHARERVAFRALCGVGAAKDVVVFTHDEFERQRAAVSTLPRKAEEEGRLVYTA